MKQKASAMRRYLKEQPLSILAIAAVWVVCMIPIPETPLDNVAMIDKWTHFVMYCTIVVCIMAEYGHRKRTVNWRRLTVGGIVLPVTMGGLVELAQAYLTNGVRSGDWLDFLANSVGVLIGCVIGIPLALFLSRRNKGV